ncbi:hypothetical protein D1007_55119 [Hordeum vulgare]|nr:hypothetical protein D1007_55119 [Hordeum vulgare]
MTSHAEARLIGEMIIKELLGHHIASLQSRSRPLLELADGGDLMRLYVTGMSSDELDGALGALLAPCVEDLPRAMPPLYACDDMKGMVAKMPAFHEWELVEPHKDSPIMVSSSGEDIKGQREAAEAKAVCTSALAEKEVLTRHCEEEEAGLKVLQEATKALDAKLADRDSKLARAAAEQVTERGRFQVLQRKVVEARDAHAKQVPKANAKLAAREKEARATTDAKALADHVALSSLDLRAQQGLSSICRMGPGCSFVPQGAGYAEFSSEFVTELEGAAKKVDNILEGECRNVFSLAATRVFSHLLLREPHFKFEGVMGPLPQESHGDRHGGPHALAT